MTFRRAALVGLAIAALAAAVQWRHVPSPTPPAASQSVPAHPLQVTPAPRRTPTAAGSPSTAPTAPPIPDEAGPGENHNDLDPYASPSAGEDAPANTQPPGDTTQARAAWEPVVEGFGRRFPDTGRSAQAWRKSLYPFTTRAVQRQLATVDPAAVPAGRYADYQVLEHGDVRVAVLIRYREGWSIVLWVISDGAGSDWQIEAYDRYEE